MEIESKAYGTITVDERQRLLFPGGLYGFEDYTEYALLDAHKRPFYWLQSIQNREVAFVLINPYLFRPDYVLDVPKDDLERIGNPEGDATLVFTILTIPNEGGEVTANLQGPLVINRKARTGIQSISLNPRWHTRHAILKEMAQK